MNDANDMELLRDYDRHGSEAAFAALVARHIHLVYSVALRHTGVAAHAEEITQAVFVILARKAASLRPDTILEGWLHETTRLTALSFLRGERRRQFREQEAYMQSTLPPANDAALWNQLAPLLDEALSRLGKKDRDAVMLRFFKDKNLREVAAALNVNEAAAQRRVHRAVEKLRGFFTKRGVTLTATVLTAAISANSVQAAPLGLAATVTAAAVKGTLISATITTLVSTTMKTMTWLKIKFAVGVSVAALLVGGAATVAVSQTGGGEKISSEEIFQKSRDAYAALTSYSDEGKTVATLNNTTITHTFTIKLARPNLYQIEWEQSSQSAAYKSTATKSAVWSSGDGDYLDMGVGGARKQTSMEMALSGATGISGGAAATIPGTFFKMNWGNQLGGLVAGKQQADERVGTVECYVFTSELKGTKKTLWIGKQDFLIHQVRSVTSAEAMKAAMERAARVSPQAAARLANTKFTGSTSTETHENIILNQKLSPADFAR